MKIDVRDGAVGERRSDPSPGALRRDAQREPVQRFNWPLGADPF
jgi:hypothetical protein